MILRGEPVDAATLSFVGSPGGKLMGAGEPAVGSLMVSTDTPSALVNSKSGGGKLLGVGDSGVGSFLSVPPGPQGPPGPTGPAGAAGVGQRPRVFHIDDYGGDPTGVTNSNQALIDCYEALDGDPGIIMFGVGTYLLYVGLNDASGRLLRPQQGVVGQGSGLTFIDYRGTGACLEFRNDTFATTSSAPAGGGHGFTILGWVNGNDDTYGIRYGDIWRMRITDVEISGFNRPGCIGLWGDNQTHWSERAYIECTVNQCTECYVFESNTGHTYDGSFDYSQYWLSFVIQPDQHGFVLRSGVSGSKASMNGASITLTGNCQLGSTNSGAMFRVGKDNADAASFSGQLQIGVETSGSGAEAHYDFMMGDGPFWEVQSRVTASGTINLIPFSGARFKQGTATSKTFAFGGMLKNSPALGSTGTVQSLQSLQLVSQARGGWFLDNTNAVHSVYVTEASGGTFTLSFDGYTTGALAYNATAADVQTALRALTSIAGDVNVYSGQARYINSVLQDEICFTVEFVGSFVSTDVPLITGNAAGLTGSGTPSITVVEKREGSPNDTYLVYIEEGSIFTMEPSPGTYRLSFRLGGLTQYQVATVSDSPFGVTVVDVWIKQPDSGGVAVFEGPWFQPAVDAGSTASFQWVDGVEPILSTVPGDVDIIRLTSYNFSKWVGQHLTRQATTTVPTPASASASGVPGQISYDDNYVYTCIDYDTWKRSALSTW